MKKLIILDRDGVINQDSDDFIKSPEEWIPIPGSLEAIAQLNQAGFTVVLASNQSGIQRGLFNLEMLEKINQKMLGLIQQHQGKIDKIYFCPHGPKDNCNCRKPKPGLFEQIGKDYQIDLKEVFCVGDALRDIEAGKAVGCQCMMVLTGKTKTPEVLDDMRSQGVQIFNDLNEVVQEITKNVSRETFTSHCN